MTMTATTSARSAPLSRDQTGTLLGQTMGLDLDKVQRWADVDATLHRPPKLRVSWGKAANAVPSFVGVIESLSISYAGGIADSGVPLHAAVDVRLAQAVHLRASA
jgi:hypothetical protein